MASVKRIDGAKGQYYRIKVYVKNPDRNDVNSKSKTFSMNWPVPAELAEKAKSPVIRVRQKAEKEIADALAVAIAKFEESIEDGKILTRKERAAQKKQSELNAAKKKSFRQFCEEVYFPQKESVSGVSVRTLDHYKGTLKHVYKYPLADFLINEISPVMISKMYLDEKESGTSVSMIKRIDTCLRQVFDLAFKLDLCEISPMLKVDKPQLSKQEKAEKKKIQSLSAEQLTKVILCAEEDYLAAKNRREKDTYFKWYMFISLMAFSGARCGELCGLTWNNVDFCNGTILIDKHIIFSGSEGLKIEKGTKTGKERIIPIDSKVMNLLREYKHFQMHKENNILKMTKWVFTQPDGATPMSPQSPVQYLHKFSKKHGLEGMCLHPHLFRHTFASLCVAGNVDIASLSANLGHAQISTTLDMYVHASLEGQKKASAIFSNVLKSVGFE